MILTCPNCSTQYVVKDGAIPPQGRQVRCASCKHSWHQYPDPEEDSAATPEVDPVSTPAGFGADPVAPVEAASDEAPSWQNDRGDAISEERMAQSGPPAEDFGSDTAEAAPQPDPFDDGQTIDAVVEEAAAVTTTPNYETVDESSSYHSPEAEYREDQGEDESLIEASIIEPRSGVEAEQLAYDGSVVEEFAEDSQAPGANYQPPVDIDQPHEPGSEWVPPPQPVEEEAVFSPFAEEEPESRRRPLVVILIVALIVVALAGLFWFAAPPEWKARVGLTQAGSSPLALVMTHMDRQKLASGDELLTVTGRVINPTSEEQPVPALQAQLKSAAGKIVYSWTIAPPAQTLAPGASASFNSAEVNVPAGGEAITLTLGSAKS